MLHGPGSRCHGLRRPERTAPVSKDRMLLHPPARKFFGPGPHALARPSLLGCIMLQGLVSAGSTLHRLPSADGRGPWGLGVLPRAVFHLGSRPFRGPPTTGPCAAQSRAGRCDRRQALSKSTQMCESLSQSVVCTGPLLMRRFHPKLPAPRMAALSAPARTRCCLLCICRCDARVWNRVLHAGFGHCLGASC